jgi:hypothetical protein
MANRRRPSGGKRRTLALKRRTLALKRRRCGQELFRLGRPKGPSSRVRERRLNIERDLIWFGEPDRSYLKLAQDLLNPEASELASMRVLVEHEPEYLHAYNCISERSLRKDVADIQKKIWGPKD